MLNKTSPESSDAIPPKKPVIEGEKEVGYVVSTQDYIVNLEGLPSARLFNIVTTKKGSRAIVSALENDRVEALMLDSERPKPGDYFQMFDYGLRIPLHVKLFGRVINPLGMPLDGKAGLPPGGEPMDFDLVAPGIDGRAAVTKQFYTGITVIDTLLPIGVGQRELILCEPRSGKEQFFLDVILSQKNQNRVCIYAAIGRSELEVKRFSEEIIKSGAAEYTIIVAATSSESAPMIQIAPAVAASC